MKMSHGVFRMSLVSVAAFAMMGFTGDAAAVTRAGRLPWWGWLLIILAIIALACLIWWCLSRRRRSSGAAGASGEVVQVSKPSLPSAATVPVVATEPEPAVAPATVAQPVEPDDLRKIEGIGPKVAGLLNEVGIASFAGLAASDLSSVREVLERARLPMIDPSTWAEQAALAAEGKWEELTALQDALKGGRRA